MLDPLLENGRSHYPNNYAQVSDTSCSVAPSQVTPVLSGDGEQC